MKLKIYKFFKIPYCNKCLGTNLNKNYWSRGWDKIYGGCSGSHGTRCFDCGYIESYEKYRDGHNLEIWDIYEDSPRYKDGHLI